MNGLCKVVILSNLLPFAALGSAYAQFVKDGTVSEYLESVYVGFNMSFDPFEEGSDYYYFSVRYGLNYKVVEPLGEDVTLHLRLENIANRGSFVEMVEEIDPDAEEIKLNSEAFDGITVRYHYTVEAQLYRGTEKIGDLHVDKPILDDFPFAALPKEAKVFENCERRGRLSRMFECQGYSRDDQ